MKRITILAVASVAIFLAGMLVYLVWDPNTFAEHEARVDDTTIVLRITKKHGSLYASAIERRGDGSTARRSIRLIGEAATLGTADPKTVTTDRPGRFRLSVGTATIEYDASISAVEALP